MSTETQALTGLTTGQVRSRVDAALLGPNPAAFFEALRRDDQLLPWFEPLAALIGVVQSPIHHAEGDVWTHTMMVLEEAAPYREKVQNPLHLMLGALTHDFGKAICTQVIGEKICSYEHEVKGLPLVEGFLQQLGYPEPTIAAVLELVRYHMQPNAKAAQKASIKSTNRMFDQVRDPLALVCLAAADGKGKRSTLPFISYEEELLERLAIYYEYLARPEVTGDDLRAAGLPEEQDLSVYLEFSHKLLLAGVEKPDALQQTLARARKDGLLPKRRSRKRGSGQSGAGL